jgi:maltokinase
VVRPLRSPRLNPAALAAELRGPLPAHLSEQRWYGAKHRGTPSVAIASIDELLPPWPAAVRVVIGCDDGPYQLVLGLRPSAEHPSGALPAGAVVGPVTVEGGEALCFDAFADEELALALLRHIAPAERAARARPMGAEQSNTSIVYDERVVLKVFRRPASPNPEIEMIEGLAGVGFDRIAMPIAVWRDEGDDLAVLQHFLPGGIDGWTMALASAQAADDTMTAESAALGQTTAALHAALADAFGTASGTPAAWAEAAAVRVRAVEHPAVDHRAALAALDAVGHLDDAGATIRIHGDYHLGQVLRTGTGWYVLDFEGEPTRPVEERRRGSSPLRDVAGMLRSFAYAASAAHPKGAPVGTGAAHWERRNREAFLGAYLDRLTGTRLLPTRPEAVGALLDLFELDKAIYEVGYEQGNRPDWVHIPVAGVDAVLARRAGS